MKKMELPELPDDVTERSDDLLPAYKAACKNLAEYLNGKIQGGDKVKTSAVVISGFGRIVASETNKLGLRMMAAKLGQSTLEDDKQDKIKLLK